ncbi:sigma-Y antisigma factor component [Bacillus sp. Bva_UNVM-123]|uniref:sigma-Y antisigma factor component n=1 Tax=Bacillus sp. Bva_UNVM-123 TaxID=2829798 RepID=UPI00391EE37D
MNEEISPLLLVMTAFILIFQSSFLFLDARKYGHNYWLWGIWGLTSAPMPILVYLVCIRKPWRKRKSKSELKE